MLISREENKHLLQGQASSLLLLKNSHIYLSLGLLSNWVSMLEDTLHLNILTFVFQSINRISPSCFHNHLQPNSNIHKDRNLSLNQR